MDERSKLRPPNFEILREKELSRLGRLVVAGIRRFAAAGGFFRARQD
jgi:hypothetical protein